VVQRLEARYVTTYRCDEDWLSSLEETRKHFLAHIGEVEDREKLVAFFRRHDIPVPQVVDATKWKTEGSALLDKIQKRELILSP